MKKIQKNKIERQGKITESKKGVAVIVASSFSIIKLHLTNFN